MSVKTVEEKNGASIPLSGKVLAFKSSGIKENNHLYELTHKP